MACFKNLRRRLRVEALKLCGNGTDAEDLVQDVLERLVRTFGQEALDASLMWVWCWRTLTNLFIDQLRKKRTARRAAADPTLAENMVSNGRAQATSYGELPDEVFQAAVEGLSPRLRETIKLHARGMKHVEVAQALCIPLGTVGKRLHMARRKLRKVLRSHLRNLEPSNVQVL